MWAPLQGGHLCVEPRQVQDGWAVLGWRGCATSPSPPRCHCPVLCQPHLHGDTMADVSPGSVQPAGPAGTMRKDSSEEQTVSRSHHTALDGLTPWLPHPAPCLSASHLANSLQGQLEMRGGLPHPALPLPSTSLHHPQRYLILGFPIPSDIPVLTQPFLLPSLLTHKHRSSPVTAMLIPLQLPFPPCPSHGKLVPSLCPCQDIPPFLGVSSGISISSLLCRAPAPPTHLSPPAPPSLLLCPRSQCSIHGFTCPAAPCWKGNGKDQTPPVLVSRSLRLA